MCVRCAAGCAVRCAEFKLAAFESESPSRRYRPAIASMRLASLRNRFASLRDNSPLSRAASMSRAGRPVKVDGVTREEPPAPTWRVAPGRLAIRLGGIGRQDWAAIAGEREGARQD
jgi:hypothetical protein